MVFAPGPIFANIVLADEINRTPPKTQSALLEAMQEHRVTIQGRTYTLDRAVLRLRHAEPDRARGHLPAARGAARSLHVPHRHRAPARRRGVRRRAHDDGDHRSAVPAAGQRRRPGRVPARWCAACRWPSRSCATRSASCAPAGPKATNAPDSVKKFVAFGASVRAAQYLVLGAKARGADRRAAITSASRTSARWRIRCCGTACSPTSARESGRDRTSDLDHRRAADGECRCRRAECRKNYAFAVPQLCGLFEECGMWVRIC